MRRSKKITAEKVNEIPELIEKKKMTLREAQDIVWEHIYTNPVLYGINDLEEDSLSEFLLYLAKKIKRYIIEYKKERKSAFITYLTMLLHYEKKTWLRIEAKKITIQTSCMENFEMNYESQFEDYKLFEPEKCVAELNELDIEKLKKLDLHAKKKEIAKETILFLLLKSCHNTTDRMISAVSRFCGIDENKLFELVEDLRKKTMYKVENRQRHIDRIQNQYYYHRRYALEIERINENTKDFSNLQYKLNRRSASWRRCVFAASRVRMPCPSNMAIAETLNTTERTVQRYISQAVRKNTLDLDDCEEDDDLSIK